MAKFVLQWHILHQCNLNCTHCYQEDNLKSLSFDELKNIFYQFLNFCKTKNFNPHINLTGGEPFLYKDLFLLLDLFENNNVTFGILTNGTLLTKEIVHHLNKYKNLSFIQVSIDGIKKTHDKIRGIGNYDKAINGLKLLKKEKIQTMVAFTCHKDNMKELQKVITNICKIKIDRFWCDRLIPIGENQEEILSTEEYKEICKVLEKNKKRKHTKIHMNRALQFLCGGNEIYHCSAGINLLTILANGDLLPCRRLPIIIGNVLEKNILELYESSPIIQDLNKKEIPKECMSCLKAESCRGGAKCLSYALKQNYHIKDVNCYY